MSKAHNKPSLQETIPAHKTIWERISSPITLISIIVTVLLASFVYYHSQQKEVWEGRLNKSKEELDLTKQELGRVKEDLRAHAEREAKQTPTEQQASGRLAASVQITVMKSQTLSVGGTLSITVTDLKFLPNPPRYTVTAKALFKDSPEMQIRNAEEGYTVTYPKENGYNIQIQKADSISAVFSITKNP